MSKKYANKVSFLLITAALLHICAPPLSYGQESISDLTGVWRGTQINGNLLMYYEICLTKIGKNEYSGVDYCRWQRNLNNEPIRNKGELPHAKKIFLGKFDGSVLWFSEIGNIEQSNWGLLDEQLRLFDNNGTPELWDNDKSQPARKFHLTKIEDSFPEEYHKYSDFSSFLRINDCSYNNGSRATHLRYNESGRIEIEVENHSDIDFKKLEIVVSENDADNLSRQNNDEEKYFILKSNEKQLLSKDFNTGFSFAGDSIHLLISLVVNGVNLFSKDLQLSYEPFFKKRPSTTGIYSSPSMKAVGPYYGFIDSTYHEVAKSLDLLEASGDKIAMMWKSIFLYKGIGGYKPDELKALNLGKESLNAVENKARMGEIESIHLMYYACQMGLEGRKSKQTGAIFLDLAVRADFRPALYDQALQDYINKNFEECNTMIIRSFQSGVRKAAVIIASMYEKGYYVQKNIDSALVWYNKGINFGDPDALYHCAILYSHGEDVSTDLNRSFDLATKAANKNCPGAMFYLANLYFHGMGDIPPNIPLSIKWFQQAAEYGDLEGMYAMAVIYTDGDLPGIVKNERTAFSWAKKAAELGQSQAMKMLSKFYEEGNVVGKNIIKSRYWFNQCVLRGEENRQNANTNTVDLLNIWRYADFSPTYYYTDSYGNYLGDGDPDLFGGLLTGFLGSYFESRMRTQPMINGLEFIQNKNEKRIYGGTITSQFTSGLELRKGQIISIKAYGTVTLGWMLSNIPADGIDNPFYAIYSILPTLPHGAVMAGMNNNWQFIGKSGVFMAPADGMLSLAINDADYSNNQGYFDIVIEVAD